MTENKRTSAVELDLPVVSHEELMEEATRTYAQWQAFIAETQGQSETESADP